MHVHLGLRLVAHLDAVHQARLEQRGLKLLERDLANVRDRPEKRPRRGDEQTRRRRVYEGGVGKQLADGLRAPIVVGFLTATRTSATAAFALSRPSLRDGLGVAWRARLGRFPGSRFGLEVLPSPGALLASVRAEPSRLRAERQELVALSARGRARGRGGGGGGGGRGADVDASGDDDAGRSEPRGSFDGVRPRVHVGGAPSRGDPGEPGGACDERVGELRGDGGGVPARERAFHDPGRGPHVDARTARSASRERGGAFRKKRPRLDSKPRPAPDLQPQPPGRRADRPSGRGRGGREDSRVAC